MTETPQFLVVGQVIRPHGIRGELRLLVLTNYPEHLTKLDRIVLSRSPETNPTDAVTYYDVERIRLHQRQAIAKLQDLDDRNEAELLREYYVLVPIEDAVQLEEDEYYHFQLIGLEMVTVDGRLVGVVREILETGANDVYVLEHPEWGEVLIPAIESVVQTINLEAKRIIIQPMDGLLPDDA